MNITYLGPAGSTFSAIAYDKLAALYGAPLTTDDGAELSLAKKNEEILPLVLGHGGFGAIAMETRAEGRVDQPINSFIELLRRPDTECPIRVIGAFSMKIRFALMAQRGLTLDRIKAIAAHPKALGACRGSIRKLGVEAMDSLSNGKAAEDVSLSSASRGLAALGPIEAAQRYGLDVLAESFEDKEAATTFFLVGPRGHNKAVRTVLQRNLTVFRVPHLPGALVKVLTPLSEEGINMRLIHSLHLEGVTYDFAIETESWNTDRASHERALEKASMCMERSIQFGPFPMVWE